MAKVPRFAFEKFQGADPRLTTQMKSVGEVMAIGRTFKQALQKAARSLEIGRAGSGHAHRPRRLPRPARCAAQAARDQRAHGRRAQAERGRARAADDELREVLLEVIRTPLADRLWYIVDALRVGATRRGDPQLAPWSTRGSSRSWSRSSRRSASSRRFAGAADPGRRLAARQGDGLLGRHDRPAHRARRS